MRIIFSLIFLLLTACSAAPPVEDTGPTSGVLLATWVEGEKPFVIRLVDPATGQDVTGFEPIALPSMHIPAYALSPDGERLAVIETYADACQVIAGGETCRENAQLLHLVGLADRREVTAQLPDQGWVELLAFDPDGLHLALVKNGMYTSTLMLFEAQTGRVLAEQVLDFRPSHLHYTQDGANLVLYGQPDGTSPLLWEPDPPHVALIDAADLEVLWEQELVGLVSGMWCLENCNGPRGTPLFVDWRPAVVASPEGKQLYILHADQERLTAVDFNSRTVGSTEIQARKPLIERLLALGVQEAKAKGFVTGGAREAALSGDGKQIYVVTQTTHPIRGEDGAVETIETRLIFQVLDIARSQQVDSLEIAIDGTFIDVSDVVLTPDGAFLVLNGWSDGGRWAQVLDVKRLKPVVHLEGWELVIHRQDNGQPMVLGSRWEEDGRLALAEFAWLDPRSFAFRGAWEAEHDYAAWLVR